jgi:hypothetical protein
MALEPLLIAALLSGPDPTGLPDARDFVLRLIDHQKQVDELREQYTYKVRELEYAARRDDDGVTWKKKEERVSEVYPSHRLPVERLLERDGRPLSEKDARKEDERIQKQIAKWQEKEDRRLRDGKAEADEDDDRVKIRDLLRATRLETVARESEDGRALLVIDFQGDPAFPARTRAEKIAQRLEGRMWVDEGDLQVARLEARLGKFSIAGGIVAKLKEARFYFEQRRMHDEVWLPARGEAEYRAKVLLVKGIDGRWVGEFYDFQRFGTESAVSFSPEDARADCVE